MKKIAFLFPGQGSQSVGMGKDIYDAFDFVRKHFDMAEAVTGLPLRTLCFEGPMASLTETVNLQPAVTLINLSYLAAVSAEGVSPAVSAGHSLGEYSALAAAGIVSNEDAVKLVYKRGELMHREALKNKGAMAAVIGLTIDKVQSLVERVDDGIVAVANHNAEKQIVITGEPASVKAAGKLASAEGGKTIPLKVSGAWHSPLIQGAEEEFCQFLNSAGFKKPESPVIHNVTADIADDPHTIRSLMTRQLCSPVKWYDTVLRLMEMKVEIFAEIGPGKVLTGLMKKIAPKDFPCETYSINSLAGLDAFLKAVA